MIKPFKSLRTKSDWKSYHENSLDDLNKYEETNPTNKDFLPATKPLFEKLKEKLPMVSKTENDIFNALMSGDRSCATISEDFDEWSIYFLAHKVSSDTLNHLNPFEPI